MKTNFNMLSPYDASEGTLYLIFVATLLSHANAPNYFGLDNVDGTLNPGLVRHLVDHIVRTAAPDESHHVRKQVFLTSHNPTALDALNIFNSSHAVFVTNRMVDQNKIQNDESYVVGETRFRRLLPPSGMTPQKWNERARGRNLSELYIANEIQDALG